MEGDFDTRPQRVEQWLAELPRANVGETTRQLYRALNETNGLQLPAGQRFRVLELMRPVVHEMVQAMQKHFLGMHFPLPEKNRRIAALSRALLNQMAIGYRIVVNDEARRPRLLRDGRALHVAAHRAMNYLSQTLRQSYLVYAPTPRGAWHELHQLHFQCRELQLERGRHPALPGEFSAETVSGLYRQTLLLALVCPYRLRQEEMRWIEARLAGCSEAARLLDPGSPGAEQALFVVLPESDDPPGYLALKKHLIDGGEYLLLDTSEMAAAFEQQDAGDDAVPPPRTTTVQRALLAWGVMPKRRFSRRGLEAEAEVAMGLTATHHFLVHGGEAGCLADTGPARFEASEPSSTETRDQPDVWELAGTPRWHADDEVRMVDLPETFEIHPERILGNDGEQPSREKPETPAPLERWKMSDISAGGLRLLWENDHSSRAEVGELVGMVEQKANEQRPTLSIGVIRWMKCGESAGLELGVEMIAPGAAPIGARPAGSDSAYLPGLLLPELPAVHQPSTLVLTTLPFRLGDEVEICTGSGKNRVRLTHLLENTGGFAQYEFEPCQQEGEGDETLPDESAFEDLWKSL